MTLLLNQFRFNLGIGLFSNTTDTLGESILLVPGDKKILNSSKVVPELLMVVRDPGISSLNKKLNLGSDSTAPISPR